MSVKASTFLHDARTELKNFLASYFDGKDHDFGDETLTIPEIDMVFERPQIPAELKRPLLAIQPLAERPISRQATTGGMRKRFDQPYQFVFFTADKKGWKKNDELQSYLEVVLSGAGSELGAVGLKPVRISNATQIPMDPSNEYQVSQRIVTFRVMLVFKSKS